jgi:pimeloyl-ACP methyl ester carboxylesterase
VSTYVLIHGAGSDSWYWHLVAPQLEALGHAVVAPDLPCDDATADFETYADVVVAAIGDRTDLVVVGQSLGGFTAPLVCARVPVDLLVLVAAMIPRPNESGSDWWDNTGWEEAKRALDEEQGRQADAPFDPLVTFFHDVDPVVTAEAFARGEHEQSGTPFAKPWPLRAWPDVRTEFVLCRDDRFFPAPFMRSVVTARLGRPPDEIDSGHLPALAHPHDLVERLERYRRRAT